MYYHNQITFPNPRSTGVVENHEQSDIQSKSAGVFHGTIVNHQTVRPTHCHGLYKLKADWHSTPQGKTNISQEFTYSVGSHNTLEMCHHHLFNRPSVAGAVLQTPP